MTTRFVRVAAAKDLQCIRRDPYALAMWLGIPIVLALMISLLFGRAPVTPQGRLLVADLDDSLLSRVFASAFSQGPLAKMVTVESVSETDGLARIRRGDGSALLIVPKGTQDAYLRNRPTAIRLLTNPSQRILPQMIEEAEGVVVEAGFYLRKVAGNELNIFLSESMPSAATMDASAVSMSHIGLSISRLLAPPLIELETTVVQDKPKAAEKKPSQSFAGVFLPSMVFLSLLFIANGIAHDIWKERNAGTLRRTAVTSAPLSALLAGKVLTVALVFAGIAALGLASLALLADLPPARLPVTGAWLVTSGSVGYLLMLLISLRSSTARSASVWGNLIVLPMSMLGGGLMPFETMPAWMAAIGRKTPNGWALTQFNAMAGGDLGAAQIALSFLLLAAVGALAYWLAARALRRALVA